MSQLLSKTLTLVTIATALTAGLCSSPDPAGAQGICATSTGGDCDTVLADLAVSDGTPDLFFFDTDVGQPDWQLRINEGGVGRLTLVESNPGPSFVDPLIVDAGARDNAIRIGGDGRIGLGTATPAQELHIVDAGVGFGPAIRFQDDSGQDWELEADNLSFAAFDVTNGARPLQVVVGAPDYSLYINGTGEVGIGTGSPEAELHVVGTTRLDGALRVLSSRTAKEDFVSVDPRAVLARVASLPIQEWSYRESDGSRHVGPVAEDFYAAFSLGESERSINPLDLSGVALAAIQGLQAALAEQQTETERLLAERDREIERLAERMARLEARLMVADFRVSPTPQRCETPLARASDVLGGAKPTRPQVRR